jgi:hypothetical protein
MPGSRLVIALVLVASTGACSRPPANQPPSTGNAPAGAGAPARVAQAGVATVTGPVRETMDAASYTYVRVGTDKGDVWAAAPQFAVKVGDRVVVPLEMPMQNFHSQSLNRDFPVIYFVSAIRRDGDAAATATSAPLSPMASHGASTAEPAEKIAPMPAPAGGTTIADLWASRKALAGKTVTVRGKVVKFNGGILGRNWIHLQDGTGTTADSTNDITVTTGEDVVVKVGDTIAITGTVVLDKDFGAGYAYGTLIENARLAGKS